ncbi:helix-turn-helix domain-containing protein [Pseudofrankia inefficax]|uniref:Transcriptional regulator, IclR family n=1 Tax=Pseudofrankia inefficax (strain DSM 45817 / CECT 9037 / DDB 130130 / EuI1c) TaxID=298654 RepID=E3IVH9_PSEI1|nr:helix-turn-helix domain-containing protein [Pseudofrankia inefficax]ADP82485.1 transcriptional regulator, IclR family [Pseudofrankia inefficax]
MPNAASPPTARVLDVLELLARSDEEPPRLRDLVRDLGLTQATAHAIMATLCDRGWAVRDPTSRAFTPGPALTALAARAGAGVSRRRTAREVVRQLAHDLGHPSVVTERVGDELVITTLDLGPCQVADLAAGERLPFAAPFGVAFAAWEDDDGRRAWMRRGAITDPALTGRLDDLLTATHERGFSIERMDPAMTRATRAMTALRDDPQARPVRRAVDGLLSEIANLGFRDVDAEANDRRPVTAISAPVFDPRTGQVTASVGVHPLRALSAQRAGEIGRHVTQATATLDAPAPDATTPEAGPEQAG